MKYLENGWKKVFTYFIKVCIPLSKTEEGPQDQLIVNKEFLYAALRKLSKKNRTKINMKIIFTGSRAEVMQLIQKLNLQLDYNNIDWTYLQEAQEAIRDQIVSNYEAKKEILWQKFDEKHPDLQYRQHMRVQVRYTIVEKRLNWMEDGQERLNMNRIQNNFLMEEESTVLEPNSNSSSSSSNGFLIHANTEQTGMAQQNNQQDYLIQNLVSLPNDLQLPIFLDSSMKLALENEFLSQQSANQSLYCDEEDI